MPRSAKGSALVITLSILVLIVILIVGLFAVIRTERASARSRFEGQRAWAMATLAREHALSLLREGIEAGSASGKFWASQPGKITVFNEDGTVDTDASRPLVSTHAGAEAGRVDLNEPGFGRLPPIVTAENAGTPEAPVLEVDWIPVLEDPLSPAGADNRLIGRYAFWVDDETARINVNTADGSRKGSNDSFGAGLPTEVSLGVLKEDTTALTPAQVRAIADQARVRPFNTPSEILQNGAPAELLRWNGFDLTQYSRAPELNFFGEPKIHLVTTGTGASGEALNAMLGAYSPDGRTDTLYDARPMASLYPLSGQLPAYEVATGTSVALPQVFLGGFPSNSFTPASADYAMGLRIARYLKGLNSRGEAIQWPLFPGADAAGFAGKYTDRQIDSIALQILTLLKAGTVADQYRGYTLPYIMKEGFLSGKLVKGFSYTPRANEIYIQIRTMDGSPPRFSMRIVIEWVLPKEFANIIPKGQASQWHYGRPLVGSWGNVLNGADSPKYGKASDPNDRSPTGDPGRLGGYWMDNLLTVLDQNGEIAGVDLYGNPPSLDDPDPRNALYHPWANGKGTGPSANAAWPTMEMRGISPGWEWKPGEYHSSQNHGSGRYYPMREGTTSISLRGGIVLTAHSESGTYSSGHNLDPVPLESMRGPYTGEDLNDPAVRAAVLEAVLPLPNVSIPVPGQAIIHMQVADPMVNSMPGDWIVSVNPPASEITMVLPTDVGSSYTDGENTAARIAAKADPQAHWWPEQRTDRPRSTRFPSIGFLQHIRTGLMPDKATEALPYHEQHGTPYRLLNFAPSTDGSQKTDGGTSYPDWAMLDLFTVPAAYQPLGSPVPEPFVHTWGGATSGRVNVNSAIHPFGALASDPLTPLVRDRPLEAVFEGIRPVTGYDTDGTPAPVDVDAADLARAIREYQETLGRPLMTPGEIANVPEVAASLYGGVETAARSRNDLVREAVGNLTTRSNTFTIWAVGEVIRKSRGNTGHGAFENGDQVIGRSRLRVLVERHLDYGADGVPGNAANPGPDGIVGTTDDPVDPVNHPAMTYPLPHRYRVIHIQEVP